MREKTKLRTSPACAICKGDCCKNSEEWRTYITPWRLVFIMKESLHNSTGLLHEQYKAMFKRALRSYIFYSRYNIEREFNRCPFSQDGGCKIWWSRGNGCKEYLCDKAKIATVQQYVPQNILIQLKDASLKMNKETNCDPHCIISYVENQLFKLIKNHNGEVR